MTQGKAKHIHELSAATTRASKRIKKTREERLEELYRAACEVLNEKNCYDFTVKDVADKIGIGRGTLYEFIKTKNDIIYLVLKRLLNEAIQYVKSAISDCRDPWKRSNKLFGPFDIHLQQPETALDFVSGIHSIK